MWLLRGQRRQLASKQQHPVLTLQQRRQGPRPRLTHPPSSCRWRSVGNSLLVEQLPSPPLVQGQLSLLLWTHPPAAAAAALQQARLQLHPHRLLPRLLLQSQLLLTRLQHLLWQLLGQVGRRRQQLPPCLWLGPQLHRVQPAAAARALQWLLSRAALPPQPPV